MPDAGTPGKRKLGEAIAALQDTLVDLSSLTVETWTGDVGAVLQSSGTGEPAQLNWAALSARVSESPGADGQPVRTLTYGGDYELVAATRVAVDFDTWNFRSRKATTDWGPSLELHQAALDSAVAGRAALLNLVLGLLGRVDRA